VNFVPEVLKDYYYSADVVVELEIVNENGDRVNLQEEDFTYANGNPIYMDESAEATFSWIPVRDGRYKATVTSYVTDAQCVNSLEASASKNFSVLPARPNNECYTLMNNLDINNSFPMVGDDLMFTFEKLSNYADINHLLYPIATDIEYEIYEGATLVDSGSLTMNANSNSNDYETYSFNWVPTQAGQMKIVVTGVANNQVCDGLTNTQEVLELNFNVAEIPTYYANLQFADELTGEMIGNVEVTLNGSVGYTDSMGLVTFEDLEVGTYDFTAIADGYVTLHDSIEIIDGNIGQSYLMTPLPKNRMNVEIDCFNPTIVGDEQYCSVYVTNMNNNIIPNANVEIRYDSGDIFGRCTTSNILGSCIVGKVENNIGEFSVRAKATHNLHLDTYSDWFNYAVIESNVTNSTITFTNMPPTVAYVDELYSFDLDAVSDEGVVLFNIIDAPIGFTMTLGGFMQWTPTEADLGLHSVTVQANDGINTKDLTWTIEVKDNTTLDEEEDLDEQLDVVKVRFPLGEVVSPGDELRVSVTIDNSGDVDFEDIKLTVMSYDLQERRSVGPFDIDEGDVETKSVSITIPEYTPAGEYDIRIVVRSDDIKRIKHRIIKVI
ncbi:hypothetical protein KY334_06160, partial [Candidatus Woesearchaeota archaeon]|nr:hypothetical protein [Candidatus Woesearchaeota archaeon]